MKELVVFDIDNTIVDGYSQQLFLSYLYKKGFVGFWFYSKLHLWFILYKMRLVRNPKKAAEYAYGFLKGNREDDFQKVIDDFFESVLKEKFFEKMVEIIDEHRERNRELLIVSSVVDIIVKKVALFLNIEEYVGTELEVVDGKFTGKVGSLVYGKNKLEKVKDFAGSDFDLKNVWAYGDHISDLNLLENIGHPVAVNPGKYLYKKAKEKNWPVLCLKE